MRFATEILRSRVRCDRISLRSDLLSFSLGRRAILLDRRAYQCHALLSLCWSSIALSFSALFASPLFASRGSLFLFSTSCVCSLHVLFACRRSLGEHQRRKRPGMDYHRSGLPVPR